MKITDVSKGNDPFYALKSRKIMKTCILLLFLLSMPLCAENLFSQGLENELKMHNATVEEVLEKIEKNTSYSFLYSDGTLDLNKRIDVNLKSKNINEILNTIFKGTNIHYKIVNKQIVLSSSTLEGNKTDQAKTTISGIVKDKNGEAIIGASVVVKGSTNGTITDIDGKFSIQVPSGSLLIVSYVGYLTTEVPVNGKNHLTIVLKEDNKLLDEVVVVGYGTMKKKDLTGAVSSLSGDAISSRHATQLSSALQGSSSGVMVTRDNSAPGATASIQIRGITTISDSSPLVIVDGVPGDINQVNPEDVESMSVLKDAASASIYGSRAAAGVIVITTKRAKDNDLILSYNFEYGTETPTTLPKNVGIQRYLEMTNELRYNDNNAGGRFQTYSEDQVNNWVNNNATDPDKYPITDWQDVLLKNSAPRQTHTLTIAGGGKVVKTKASFRYDKTEGLYANRDYDRYLIRINNDFNINKYIEAHLDVNFKRSLSNTPFVNPLNTTNRSLPPVYAVRWTNGLWSDVKDGGNVLAMITDGGKTQSYYNRLAGKGEIIIKPFDGLRISAVIAPTYNFDKIKSFRKQIPFTYADDPNTIKGYMQDFYTTSLTEKRNDNNDITSQFFANYTKNFGKHDINVMLGYEDYYSYWENLGATADQYELSDYPFLNLSPKDYRDNSGNAYEYAYQSVFGRINYSYNNKYLLEVNFRRDGSSRFAKENRWANFPSFSAGWVISQEKFMNNIDWFSNLKIRASWGKLGNERIGSYYPYQASLDFGSALFYSSANGDVISSTTASQGTYAVHDISWETTSTWDLGFDASFFNNRLAVTFDYYNKDTKDMLLALQIPQFMGYNNPSVNAGKMNTKGYDIQINWNDNIGDLRYSAGVNLSDFVSKMGDLNGTEFLGDQIKIEGSEFNEWYGYKSDGLFLTQEDLDNSPKLNNNIKIGDVKYVDISGPKGEPDGKISPEYDRVLLGGSLPRFMFGTNFNASYKGFDLGLVLQGVGKQWSRINSTMVEGLRDNWGGFPSLIDGNYWSSNNSDAQNAVAKYPRLTRSNKDANLAMSDFWLFNGRYVRLKNITLGYTIPSFLTEKVLAKSVRIYVSANDLFSLSGYPKGWDPEVGAEGYPITKSLLFGVNVNF